MIVGNIAYNDETNFVKRSRFGVVSIDGVFIVRDETEANAIFKHFALFSKSKQLLNEQMRLEAILN